MDYFLDTYLNSKDEWVVSAHPNGDGNYRSVQITLPNLWNDGNNATSYFWIRLYEGAADSPHEWRWYIDRTYTSVPGDLGTYPSTAYAMDSDWHDFVGDWRIWESDLNPRSILVTKGKWIAFYWPGPDKWLLKEDPAWDGSYANHGCQVGPYIGQNYESLMHSGYPSGSAGTPYALVPDVGGEGNMSLQNPAGVPAMMAGVGFLSTSVASTSMFTTSSSNPILPRTDADCLIWLPGSNAVSAARNLASSSATGVVLYNTSNGRYYLTGDQNLTNRFMVWDMGTTEPDLS